MEHWLDLTGKAPGRLPVKATTHGHRWGGSEHNSTAVTAVIPERSFSHPLPGDRTLAQGAETDPHRAAGPARILFARLLEHQMLSTAITWSRWRSVQACTGSRTKPPTTLSVGLPELLWHTAVKH